MPDEPRRFHDSPHDEPRPERLNGSPELFSSNELFTSNEEVERMLCRFAPRESSRFAPGGIDRDRLMFLAGQAAAAAPVTTTPSSPGAIARLSPAVALASLAASLVMAVLLWQHPSERVVVVQRSAQPLPARSSAAAKPESPQAKPPRAVPQVEAVHQSPAVAWESNPAPSLAANYVPSQEANYVLRRERMLREGIDSLARVEYGGGGGATVPVTQRELLEELYGPQVMSQPAQHQEWWQAWLNPGDRL